MASHPLRESGSGTELPICGVPRSVAIGGKADPDHSQVTCSCSFVAASSPTPTGLQRTRSWLRLLPPRRRIRIAPRLLGMTIGFSRQSRRATLPLLWIGERGGKSAYGRCDEGDDRAPRLRDHLPERNRLRLNAAMCRRALAIATCADPPRARPYRIRPRRSRNDLARHGPCTDDRYSRQLLSAIERRPSSCRAKGLRSASRCRCC